MTATVQPTRHVCYACHGSGASSSGCFPCRACEGTGEPPALRTAAYTMATQRGYVWNDLPESVRQDIFGDLDELAPLLAEASQ